MKLFDTLKPITPASALDIIDADGIELYSSDGKTYYDLNEISTVLGQKNKHFTKKMTSCLNGVTSMKLGRSADKEKFYRYLSNTTDHRFQYLHLTSSGSEASEWAVRMALKMTGRNEVLSFWNSIHGRTYLSTSMSGMERRKQGYAPSAPGTLYGVYPDCAHCPFEKNCSNCDFFCLKFLDEKMKYESSHEIGAVVVEAYQGSGIIVPPKGWLKALEIWAHDHGALFILDEIQSGMGRTGQMYAFQEEGLNPDMLLLGKALGNGIHVGAVLTKEAPEEYYRMALSGGAGDTELTYTAGCAVFEELLENGMLDHIKDVSHYMKSELFKLKENYKQISHVVCNGLAAYIEIESDTCFHAIQSHMKEQGLLAGFLANRKIVFRPPYAIEKKHIDLIIQTIKTAISSI
ncbi:MAG: aminotransferase class III-fold pyridoxal phosphate-dependent enzyme [Lachnospiraceae bacterium]|nr:aminotransferase class III-fold pyridoxal phosphate-dependent enzyme [Lachnospiraceae bacterium]